MSIPRVHAAARLAAAAVAFGLVAASGAEAQPKSKRIETEAEWVSFDAAARTITVKIKKPGQGPAAKDLKKNREAVFEVKPEGTVLTRTVVKINGVKAELGDLPVGKTVKIYWEPRGESRFAMLIDTTFSEEEFEERYGVEDVE